MPFPLSIKNRIELNKPENSVTFDIENVIFKNLYRINATKIEFDNGIIQFESNKTIGNFPFSAEIKIENNCIEYKYHLIEIFKISGLIILFLLFLLRLPIWIYIVTSLASALFVLIINILYINSVFKSFFNGIEQINALIIRGEQIENTQEKWITDPNKCSACGEQITIYDQYCPECGLKLKNKKLKPPFNSTSNSERILYHYKSKKKNGKKNSS